MDAQESSWQELTLKLDRGYIIEDEKWKVKTMER